MHVREHDMFPMGLLDTHADETRVPCDPAPLLPTHASRGSLLLLLLLILIKLVRIILHLLFLLGACVHSFFDRVSYLLVVILSQDPLRHDSTGGSAFKTVL